MSNFEADGALESFDSSSNKFRDVMPQEKVVGHSCKSVEESGQKLNQHADRHLDILTPIILHTKVRFCGGSAEVLLSIKVICSKICIHLCRWKKGDGCTYGNGVASTICYSNSSIHVLPSVLEGSVRVRAHHDQSQATTCNDFRWGK